MVKKRRAQSQSVPSSNEEIHAIYNQLPVGILKISCDGSLVSANQKTLEILGYTLSELLNLKYSDFLKKNLPKVDHTPILPTIFSGERKSFKGEVQFFKKDGTPLFISIRSIPVLEANGKVSHILSLLDDVTEAKQIKKEVGRLANRYRHLFEKSEESIVVTDINLIVQDANPKFCRTTGFAQAEILGKPLSNFVHPNDKEAMLREFNLRLKGTSTIGELRFESKTGKLITFLSSGIPIQEEGQITGSMGFFVDVSEQKKLQTLLEEERTFLQAVIDNLPVGIFCKDVANDYKFTIWNNAMEEITGLKQTGLLGKSDFDFFPAQQAQHFRDKDAQTCLEGIKLEIEEEPLNNPVLGRRTLRTVKVPVKGLDNTTRFLLGISEDITEKKELKDKVEFQRLKAISSAKMASLGEMAGGVAHEINNPLAIILGKTEQLKDLLSDGAFDKEAGLKILEKIESTSYRICNIIKGLRAFSRSGDADPFSDVTVRSIIDDTLELCREKFKSAEIFLKVKPIPEVVVQCRAVQLSQVILNLLNNSLDAIISLKERWIEIDVRESAETFQIVITDSGPGIPDSIVQKLMQPFFTTKEIGKGTGLGLSISKGIVEDHHGKFWYEAASKNTRFIIELPKAAQSIRCHKTS